MVKSSYSSPGGSSSNGFFNVVKTISLSFTPTRFLYIGLGIIATTYLLFQKKLLPDPIAKIVSKIYFYPTFPVTALLRLGNYWTKVDDTLILGCAPMGFLGHPEMMHKVGVKGVINMCYEYPGPVASYSKLGMKQLHLPTIDHTQPSLDKLKDAVDFIKQHQKAGDKVYVHCKAGHGRAAAVALCWMIHENPNMTAKVTKKKL